MEVLVVNLSAVFELRRALEAGEPTVRHGVETLTLSQARRRLAEMQDLVARFGTTRAMKSTRESVAELRAALEAAEKEGAS